MKVILIFLLFVSIVACKPKNRSYYLSPIVRSYLDYVPGSYWIYVDSNSGNVDSMYIYNRTISMDKNSNDGNVYQDLHLYALDEYGNNNRHIYEYEIYLQFSGQKTESILNIKSDTIGSMYISTYIPYYTNPILQIDSSGLSNYKPRHAYKIGNKTINNINYENVIMLTYEQNEQDTIFVSDNVGLIELIQNVYGVKKRKFLIKSNLIRP